MAQTTQSISLMRIEEAKNQYASSSISTNSKKQVTEDTLSLMFSVCDSINNLCLSLEKLYHVTKMTNVKLSVKTKYKEKASPHSGAGASDGEPSN